MFKSLNNIRIRTISYALVVFLLFAGAIFGVASFTTLERVRAVENTWHTYVQSALAKTEALFNIRQAIGFGGLIHNFKNYVLRGDREYFDAAQQNDRDAKAAIADYRAIGISTEESLALDAIEANIDDYASQLPAITEMHAQNLPATMIDDRVSVGDTPAVEATKVLIDGLSAERHDIGKLLNDEVADASYSVFVTLFVIASLIVILIGAFFWFAQARLVRPIYSLMEFVKRIGQGDLTEQIANLARDEVGSLGSSINVMVANLKEITLQTREAVINLNSASAETLASTKQQAASVEEQFAALQETSATLDEMSQSGQQMTTRAREIATQAEKASESSQQGLKSMDDLSQVMDAIEEQTESVAEHIVALSEKTQAIGDIISTVNDIAERSQLLALNAAIEAAAAGEEGRSFAVVAEEIKTLADQAKEATSQVASILGEIQKGINSSVMSTEESVKRVANGREQAEATLKAITELAETIDASVQAFEQIVASTNQQRVGIEQVTEAMQQIRAGSEQTAAGTRQIELAVSNINALGSQLGHTMERYAV
ncbi:MAG: methyl-accepting chemotaxis protein [Cucumibacter sp.]